MRKIVLTIVGVVVGLWLLNVLTGLFAYNFFAKKHEHAGYLMEGIGRASELRARVGQFFSQQGRLPDSNRELGIGEPETYKHGVVKSATVGPNGEIRIDYAGSGLDDAALIMRPIVNVSGTGPAVRWECFAAGIDESITKLVQEPRCAAIKDRDAVPALAEPEATVENLIAAIHGRKRSLVQHWIEAGVNVNATDRVGQVPLLIALERADSAILELLIKAGANVNLRQEKTRATPLMIAAKSGRCNPNAIRALIDAGAEVEARDEKGMTSLMHAGRGGNSNCIDALLKAGANIDATDNAGHKAINHAATYGQNSSAYIRLRDYEVKRRQGGEFFYRLPETDSN